MVKRIFGHKRKEVTGELRKLHNEEFKMCSLKRILLGLWREMK
jgi:hypothetical protein